MGGKRHKEKSGDRYTEIITPPLENLWFCEVIMAESSFEFRSIIPKTARTAYPLKLGGVDSSVQETKHPERYLVAAPDFDIVVDDETVGHIRYLLERFALTRDHEWAARGRSCTGLIRPRPESTP